MINHISKSLRKCQNPSHLKPLNIMKKRLGLVFSLFIIVFFSCDTPNSSLPVNEQEQIFKTIIKLEEDSSWGKINAAKYGTYYLLNGQFQDSIYIDDSISYLIDKKINIQKIKEQYKIEIGKNNKLETASFNLLYLIEYSNKIPIFLSFSKPIKYLGYYFVNFCFFSWSSGYSSTLILVKESSGNFRIVYRKVYSII